MSKTMDMYTNNPFKNEQSLPKIKFSVKIQDDKDFIVVLCENLVTGDEQEFITIFNDGDIHRHMVEPEFEDVFKINDDGYPVIVNG